MKRVSFRTMQWKGSPTRQAVGLVVALLYLLLSGSASASQVGGKAASHRIAIVISRDLGPYHQAVAGFREALSLRKVAASISSYGLEQSDDKDSRLRERISPGRWELILCVGSEATRFVQRLAPKTPTVFCVVSDPEGQGITTPEEAETKLAGVTTDIPVSTQFRRLREALPHVKKVGVVFDEEASSALVEKAAVEANSQGLELVAIPVKLQADVPNAFSQLRNKVDALWAIPDPTVYSSESARFILTFALGNKLPFMAYSPQYVKAGALFGLSPDYADLGRQAGEMATEVLESGRLPTPRVAHPRKHVLSINLKVMKVIGEQLPYDFVSSAEEVFE